jgi:hypothetical protein
MPSSVPSDTEGTGDIYQREDPSGTMKQNLNSSARTVAESVSVWLSVQNGMLTSSWLCGVEGVRSYRPGRRRRSGEVVRRGRWPSSGLWRHAVWWKFANVSEVLDASITRTYRPDDGGSKDLRNGGKLLPDYMALQPWRQPISYSPPWEPQILLIRRRLVIPWVKSGIFQYYDLQTERRLIKEMINCNS